MSQTRCTLARLRGEKSGQRKPPSIGNPRPMTHRVHHRGPATSSGAPFADTAGLSPHRQVVVRSHPIAGKRAIVVPGSGTELSSSRSALGRGTIRPSKEVMQALRAQFCEKDELRRVVQGVIRRRSSSAEDGTMRAWSVGT